MPPQDANARRIASVDVREGSGVVKITETMLIGDSREWTFRTRHAPGFRRVDTALDLTKRPKDSEGWRTLPSALRDVTAWAVWRYCQIPRRGIARTVRVFPGEAERVRLTLDGIYSKADVLALPAFARAFRGTHETRRRDVYRAVDRVIRLTKLSLVLPVTTRQAW